MRKNFIWVMLTALMFIGLISCNSGSSNDGGNRDTAMKTNTDTSISGTSDTHPTLDDRSRPNKDSLQRTHTLIDSAK